MKKNSRLSKYVGAIAIVVIVVVTIFVYTNSVDQNQLQKAPEISILFLGDFMIGDAYSGSNSAPFEGLTRLFEDYDDIVVNLETAVTDSEMVGNSNKTYNYKINTSVLGELRNNNVTIVNLANNHILDYGIPGFIDTIMYLEQYNLVYFGAGSDETQARQGLIRHYVNGTTIGYLGYYEYRETYDHDYHFYADMNQSGVAALNMSNLEDDIPRLREEVDILIVSFHLGSNYDVTISDTQKDFARYAVDLGADAVVIHSPHIVLPMEVYQGKTILYSIGNFIFTTPGRFYYVDEVYQAGLGAAFGIENNSIVSVQLTPFKTNNRITGFQPYVLNQSDARVLYDLIIPSGLNITMIDSAAYIDLRAIGEKSYLLGE